MDDLIIERIPVKTTPRGGFLYALHIPDTNHIQIGLGFKSMNGLQVSHVTTTNIHQFHIHEIAEEIRQNGTWLKLGKLAALFTSDPQAKEVFVSPRKPNIVLAYFQADELASAIIKVHDEAWGNPNAWQPATMSLADGRVVWLMYDDDLDRIRLGLGFVGEDNEEILGDASYLLSKHTLADFAVAMYKGRAHFFHVTPPRFPWELDRWVSHPRDLREIAIQLVRLADEVWPEQIGSLEIQEDEHA